MPAARGDLFKSVWSRWMSWTDTHTQKKTRVTVWTQCGYQSEKTSRHVIRLSRSAEGISTEESHSLWACQRCLPITGWTAKGWWDSIRLVTINFTSPSYFLFFFFRIHQYIAQSRPYECQEGRKSLLAAMVALAQQCRVHSRLSLSQADSHSFSLGPVWGNPAE